MFGSILEQGLAEIRGAGQFRERIAIESAQGPAVTVAGKTLINFCSNDYLGLANEPALKAALQAAVSEYGVGSGASQLVCGRSKAHAELEQDIARKTGRDRAIIFSSGYLANLAIVSSLAFQKEYLVCADRLSHASMIDGGLLSRARFSRFKHRDPESLKALLEKPSNKNKLVLTDGVFSMDGDIAPLDKLANICQTKQACLVVDDAHGFGVLGATGGGVLEVYGLDQIQVPLMMATFGKAAGGFGAFVAGPTAYIEILIQRGRQYIYSTALPPAYAALAKAALHIITRQTWRRDRLFKLIDRFKHGAIQLGLPLLESYTPIQPLIIGDTEASVSLSRRLFEKNVLITAIRPPTVPKNTSRLRITITAAHTEDQVDYLLETLAGLWNPL